MPTAHDAPGTPRPAPFGDLPASRGLGSGPAAGSGADPGPGAVGWWLLVPLVLSAFVRDWWSPDEPRYAEVAREAWTEGGLLVMHLCGEVYPNKPPLLFWIAGLLGRLSDWSEGWMRMASWGSTAATAAMTAHLARRWWGRAEAGWSVVVLLGCVMVQRIGAHLQLDLLLMALCTGALVLVDHARDARRPDRAVLGAGLLTGLGVLTKGPVAILHVALAVTAWWWVARPAAVTFATRRAWFGALVLSLLPAALWAGAASLAEPALAEALFYETHMGRIVKGTRHAGPIWDYALQLPLQLLPWTAAVWAGLRWSRRAGNEHAQGRTADDGLRRAALWFVLVFVVFSSIPVKRSLYLMPMYPAMALLAARGLTRSGWPARGTLRLASGTLALAGTLLVIAGVLALGDPDDVKLSEADGMAWRAPLVGTACLAGAWMLCRAEGSARVWARTLVGVVAVCATLAALLIADALDPVISDRGLGKALAARPEEPASVPCLGLGPEGIRFYSGRYTVQVVGSERFLSFLDTEGRQFLGVIDESEYLALEVRERARLAVLHRAFESGDPALVVGASPALAAARPPGE